MKKDTVRKQQKQLHNFINLRMDLLIQIIGRHFQYKLLNVVNLGIFVNLILLLRKC